MRRVTSMKSDLANTRVRQKLLGRRLTLAASITRWTIDPCRKYDDGDGFQDKTKSGDRHD